MNDKKGNYYDNKQNRTRKMCCTTALEKELLSEILLNLRLLLKIKEQGLYNGIYKDLKK